MSRTGGFGVAGLREDLTRQPSILDERDLAGLAEIDVRDVDLDGDLLAVAADSGFALLRLVSTSGGLLAQ